MQRRSGWPGGARRLALVLPFLWLVLFFLVPFGIVARMAVSQQALAQPPYIPIFSWDEGLAGFWVHLGDFTFANFTTLLEDGLYGEALLTSMRIALISTGVSLLIAYPMALAIARAPKRLQNRLILLAVAPFWTSFLIRIYAWIAILKDEGLLNHALQATGLINAPLPIFATEAAVIIGIVYSYLPFMILPVINSLIGQDAALIEAASDLGSTRANAFWTITFPLSWPGVRAGALLVFIPAMGEVVIPDLLGGSDMLVLGKSLWNDFFGNRDWPAASCATIVLLALLVVPIVYFQRSRTSGPVVR